MVRNKSPTWSIRLAPVDVRPARLPGGENHEFGADLVWVTIPGITQGAREAPRPKPRWQLAIWSCDMRLKHATNGIRAWDLRCECRRASVRRRGNAGNGAYRARLLPRSDLPCVQSHCKLPFLAPASRIWLIVACTPISRKRRCSDITRKRCAHFWPSQPRSPPNIRYACTRNRSLIDKRPFPS